MLLIKGVKIKLYNSLSTNSIWYHVQDIVKEKLLRLHYLKCFVITDSWLVNINIWASLVAQIKESTCSTGDLGLIPGFVRSSGEGKSYQLQYSCLGNPTNRGAWQATVPGVKKSQTWLSDWAYTHTQNINTYYYFVLKLSCMCFLCIHTL